jgi:hypothetical protein
MPILAPAIGQAEEDDRLVAIGALAGAHVYTTYGYIGTIADAFAHDVYDAQKVQDLTKEIVGLAEVNVKQLRKIREGNLVDEDKKVIDEVIAVYDLLQREANALSAYSKSKSKEDLDAFEQSRTTVWPKIKAALGIPDPQTDER